MKNNMIQHRILSISLTLLIVIAMCFTTYASVGVAETQKYIPIFMYHSILEEEDTTNNNYVSVKSLVRTLDALKGRNYTPIHFSDLKESLEGKRKLPPKPVILTADDGYLDNYEILFPLIKERNIKFTFFVTTDYVGDMREKTNNPHFTWAQAKEMEKSKLVSIQSHSASHTDFTTLSEEEIREEVKKSFDTIEKNLGKRQVKVFAYPLLRHTNDTQGILSDMEIDFQLTNLIDGSQIFNTLHMQRINPNSSTPIPFIFE